ncbi:sulfite:cytochrome C oxidoreductase subunit B [Alsobacter metallidurans]|uniref:Sulfite:cytochrome C oxidoreductase subunit B n=2 Tax=Alsobacter metallidurans TaxID=340221 RepID=A0A917I645_9HYPH|nr:cytochrome c [Alsobacter metallidurans]GGH14432.1 sulfite:cytochrome C oxidoreductase subunit B [Alsobacter metallidurans]
MNHHHRKIRLAGAALMACIVVAGGIALAAPKTYQLPDETAELKPGPQPGFDAAKNNCMACHSVDYINYQPGKKGQAFWEAEVQKMIKVYHAPVDEADAKAIADYLAKTY